MTKKLQLKVGGMSCSFCQESIRRAYDDTEGVRSVGVSLAHEEALVEYDPERTDEERLKRVVRSLGYTVRDPRRVRGYEEQQEELRRQKRRLLANAVLSLVAIGLMAAMWLGVHLPWARPAQAAIATVAVFVVGSHILRMAWGSLRRRIFNQHVLLSFGAIGGYAAGALGFFDPAFPADFFVAATFLMTYHILSAYVSGYVRARSQESVRKLLDLQPATARVVREGEEMEVRVEEVRIRERVRIRPGERVPVDGRVVEGRSAVDESVVTGESLPIEKAPGDEVIGGSVNKAGTLLVEVTRVGEDTFLRRVAKHVEEARALKPGIIQVVDWVLKYFVPSVLAVSAAAFLAWTLGAWLVTGSPQWGRAIFAALSVLVMGYPCALGMATPLALIRGGGMAAERGVLFRSAEAFNVLKDSRKVVFDKTGTITVGKPRVVEIVPLGGASEEEVLRVAASAEAYSEHPLAEAIRDGAERRRLSLEAPEVFESVTGLGVAARVGGAAVAVGRPRLLEQRGVSLDSGVRARMEELETRGWTVVAASRGGRLLGLLAIGDAVKDGAADALARLPRMGIEPWMITGDNRRTAEAVARAVGIQRVLAEVPPQDKAERIRELQGKDVRVVMVGDGINDAPALTQADVGIAIGTGTDIAIESADVVLVHGRLEGVLDAIEIGRNSYRKTVQNLILAFAFNGMGVPVAATGILHPIWAMVAMVASVSAVLTNSFAARLIAPRRAEKERVEEAPKEEKAMELLLEVPDMHCEGCARARSRESRGCHPGFSMSCGPEHREGGGKMLPRRSVAIALAALLGFAGAAGAASAQQEPEPVQAPETAGPQKIEMIVVGLSCPFCAYGLEKKLKKVEGVTEIDIDFKTGNVKLEVNDGSKVSDERIRKLVKDAGFEVRGEIQRSPLAESAEAEEGGRR